LQFASDIRFCDARRVSRPAEPADQRSRCPIACSLDLLGDRWTLLVVRDLLFTRRVRFGELARSSEKIPTNILTERLRRLEACGLVEKRAYQQRPKRYEYLLTPRGKDLFDVLAALIRWGQKHVEGTAHLSEEKLSAMDPRNRDP
jgi:DNA-binding HxlR family transcriptional regulator